MTKTISISGTDIMTRDDRPMRVAAKASDDDDDKDDKDDKDDGPDDKPPAKPDQTARDPKGRPVKAASDDDDAPETPQQRFEDRYPQPVRVADLVGKPLIEGNNAVIGRIKAVARSPDGALKLIVPYGGFLGFGARLVAVPNELVASIGTAIVSVDMDRAAYDKAATWTQGADTLLALDTPMRVAITRH